MARTVKEHGPLAAKYLALAVAEAILSVVAVGVAADAGLFDLNHVEELVGPIPDEYNVYAVPGGFLTSVLAGYAATRSLVSADKAWGVRRGRGVPKPIKFAPLPPTTRSE